MCTRLSSSLHKRIAAHFIAWSSGYSETTSNVAQANKRKGGTPVYSSTNTNSMSTRSSIKPLMTRLGRYNSSGTSAFACGWMRAAFLAMTSRCIAQPLPLNSPLPTRSTHQPVKRVPIEHGTRFLASMTTAKTRNQGRKAIPRFSMITGVSSTSKQDGH